MSVRCVRNVFRSYKYRSKLYCEDEIVHAAYVEQFLVLNATSNARHKHTPAKKKTTAFEINNNNSIASNPFAHVSMCNVHMSVSVCVMCDVLSQVGARIIVKTAL